jgi:hypothetical protein
LAAARIVIALVRMQLGGAPTGSSPPPLRLPQRGDGIHARLEQATVMHIRARDSHREREAIPIHHDVPFGA